MKLEIILFCIAIIINSVITYFTGLYTMWYMDIVMALLIPLTFVLLIPFYICFMALINLFMKTKKEINKPNRFASFIIKETYKLVLDCYGVKVHVSGMENIPQDEKFLIVSNHRSNWDPFPIGYYFPGNIANVTKPENFERPLIGNLIKRCAFVPMPRDDDFKAVKSIVRSAKIIKDGNSSMTIFPEGKRNKTDDVLLDFHAGSFKIATKAKCPLVIVTLTNTESIKFLKRTHIYMDIVKVYSKEEIEAMSTNDLALNSMELIKNQYLSRKKEL